MYKERHKLLSNLKALSYHSIGCFFLLCLSPFPPPSHTVCVYFLLNTSFIVRWQLPYDCYSFATSSRMYYLKRIDLFTRMTHCLDILSECALRIILHNTFFTLFVCRAWPQQPKGTLADSHSRHFTGVGCGSRFIREESSRWRHCPSLNTYFDFKSNRIVNSNDWPQRQLNIERILNETIQPLASRGHFGSHFHYI